MWRGIQWGANLPYSQLRTSRTPPSLTLPSPFQHPPSLHAIHGIILLLPPPLHPSFFFLGFTCLLCVLPPPLSLSLSTKSECSAYALRYNASDYNIKAAATHHAFTHKFPPIATIPFLVFTGTCVCGCMRGCVCGECWSSGIVFFLRSFVLLSLFVVLSLPPSPSLPPPLARALFLAVAVYLHRNADVQNSADVGNTERHNG